MINFLIKTFLISFVCSVALFIAYFQGETNATARVKSHYESQVMPEKIEAATLNQLKRFHLACAAEIPMNFTYDTMLKDSGIYICVDMEAFSQPQNHPTPSPRLRDRSEDETLI